MPHLRPPSATAYEEDRDALTAQFDAAEAMLKEIQAETNAVRIAVEEQKERVDKTTEEVQSVVKEMREGEVKTRDELRELREEVQNIRDMLPKASRPIINSLTMTLTSSQMVEKSKETHTQSLAELQQELKSLKALLLSRGPGPASGASTPIIPKPSIPAWQLAGSNHVGGSSSPALPSSPGPAPPPPPPFIPGMPLPSAKGKEVDSTPA